MSTVERLEQAKEKVQKTLRAGRAEQTSIQTIFSSEVLSKMGEFAPHPQAEQITQGTLDWVANLGFLTQENFTQMRAWATMNVFAHHGTREALKLTGENYGALYLMDDWLSNDAQNVRLSAEEQQYLHVLVGQFVGLLKKVATGTDPLTLRFQLGSEKNSQDANKHQSEFVLQTARLFEASWQAFFDVCLATDKAFAHEYARVLCEHIAEALKPQDLALLDHLEISTYLNQRVKVAGMRVGRKLVEFSTQSYESLRQIRKIPQEKRTPRVEQILQQIAKLEESLDLFGSVGNDIFSASKEVFRDGTIFNYLAVAILVESEKQALQGVDDLVLYHQVLGVARNQLRQFTESFLETVHGNEQTEEKGILTEIDLLEQSDLGQDEEQLSETQEQLRRYVEGLRQYYLATYYWEVSKDGGLQRYQHEMSTFTELLPQ